MPSRKEWTLIFIGLPGDRFDTDQLRIMKGLFLFSQEGPEAVQELYDFEPYNYGPFDTGIYHDLDSLEAEGLITSEAVLGTNRRIYKLTPNGQQRMDEILGLAPQGAVYVLARIKRHVTSLSFLDLLRDVYKRYPAYAVQSVARL